MKDILTFMGDHPGQTLFLSFITLVAIVEIIKYITIAIKGWPPPTNDDDDDD